MNKQVGDFCSYVVEGASMYGQIFDISDTTVSIAFPDALFPKLRIHNIPQHMIR